MRASTTISLVAAIAAGLGLRALAAEKVLSNLHGDVSYLANATGEAHVLAPAASTTLSDDDVAKTGDRSMGAIVLPDSSRVILASDTTIKVDAFNQVDASAHFVVAQGKLRFTIEHPQGARANYTFTTPTGNISVRGTVGDISVDALDGVRVNVYQLSQPDLPVAVTMIDGQTFTVAAGQKLWMRWQSGALVGKVQPLTQGEIDRFSELGPPPGPPPPSDSPY